MSDLIIVKAKDGINVEADFMKHLQKEIIKQKETGVIILPWFLTAIAVPEDTELKIESEEQGHWIFDDECKEHGHCSRCGYGSVDLVDGESHNFCRNCGAWMVESLERSDKE